MSEIKMDATRISDGTRVLFKKIQSSVNPDEADIGQLFSAEPHASDPSNHCVPIYDVLKVPDDEGTSLIAMPLLRPWENPVFETVGEVVDFFRQLFVVSLVPYSVTSIPDTHKGSAIYA